MPTASPQRADPNAGPHLILYDGTCGLCHGFVQWVLAHDPAGLFHFAALQSDAAAAALATFGARPRDLDTVYVISQYTRTDTPGRLCLDRARAALFVAKSLGWPWRALNVFGALPTSWLNAVYDLVARYRYRVFGRRDSCVLPSPGQRGRFQD